MYTSLLLAAAAIAAVIPSTAVAATFHGNVALTSDYVFRGISQTQGNPALQAGLRVDGRHGFYASAWGSTLKPYPDNGADAELDLVAGWNGDLGRGFALDANVIRYTYPGARRSSSDYNELIGTLSWHDRLWLQAGWSDDVFASGRSALYTQLGGRLPLASRFSLEAAIGRYRLERALGCNYTHAQVTIAYAPDAYTFRLTMHDTDHAARALFPRIAGPRIELSAAVAF